MKTTVVPAQITTVEDRIAGSLTFPQIILMVIALVIGAGIYGMMMPKLHLGGIKLSLIIIECAFFGGLALRFSGKILGDWLIIYLRYSVRPRRYIFTKNDLIHREIVIEEESETIVSKRSEIATAEKQAGGISLKEQIKFDRIFNRDDLSVSFKMSKKGGVDVHLEQAKN